MTIDTITIDPLAQITRNIDPLAQIRRDNVKVVSKGTVKVGGRHPVSIQSMTNIPSDDIEGTIAQIHKLTKAGCEIIRIAVPTMKTARAISKIKDQISIPLVSDIHFNYKLALAAIDNGTDALRLNPGNIGKTAYVQEVAKLAQSRNIPIRIGINSGSLEPHIEKKYGSPTPEAMIESAINHIRILEELDFHDIIISLKSSSVPDTLEAARLMIKERNYPLHLGVTEAGNGIEGRTKSFIGIGLLLLNGIGETIRISLTGDPVQEIVAAKKLLQQVRSLANSTGKYLW